MKGVCTAIAGNLPVAAAGGGGVHPVTLALP